LLHSSALPQVFAGRRDMEVKSGIPVDFDIATPCQVSVGESLLNLSFDCLGIVLDLANHVTSVGQVSLHSDLC